MFDTDKLKQQLLRLPSKDSSEGVAGLCAIITDLISVVDNQWHRIESLEDELENRRRYERGD